MDIHIEYASKHIKVFARVRGINVIINRVTLINLINVTNVMEGDRGNDYQNQNHQNLRRNHNVQGSFLYG
jgi:hypothetical protein